MVNLPTPPPILRVDELKKHFFLAPGFLSRKRGWVYAVDGVSFQLAPGHTLGLVGESGCGKSTLGRTILRLYEPTSGSIIVNGVDITKLAPSPLRNLRQQMQMIFQDPYSSLNPRMRVEEILSEPFLIHRVASRREISARVDKLLDRVGLSPKVKTRYPHEFSGGQKQRLGIARAIALAPQLIIADEPVSALDVSIQAQILNLLKDLQADLGLAYLFISHDLAVIEHISDQVAVMYLGRIVEQASRDHLYARPRHPYTKALIAAIPVARVHSPSEAPSAKNLLPGDVPNPADPPRGCRFHPRCPLATSLCREQSPVLVNYHTVAEPHWVACHHVH